MFTAAHIKRHIARLPKGQIFTTREFLCYGSRSAVDQSICRLVNAGRIERLARGVFVVPRSGARLPTPLEVATAKARAFGKEILQHGADAAVASGLAKFRNQGAIYVTNGPSSSFRYGDKIIQFKRIAPRKIVCGDTLVGLVIRAIWHLGKMSHSWAIAQAAIYALGRTEKEQLRQNAGFMPAWMSRRWVPLWTMPWTEGWNKRRRKGEREGVRERWRQMCMK